jgi:hypothetical protein
MAACKPLPGEPRTAGDTVFHDRLPGIFRATRMEATGGPEERADRKLVTADQRTQQPLHQASSRKRRSTSASAAAMSLTESFERSLTITSTGPRSAASLRKCSLVTRLIRFRCVARGRTRRPTTIPNRALLPWLATEDAVNHRPDPRLLALRPRLKSSPDRSRAARGKPATEDYPPDRRQTDNECEANAKAPGACALWPGVH